MCIFIASESFSHYAFVLLSNRDEYLDRETEAAHWWEQGIFAPRDLCKGGTWMGIRGNRIAILVNFHEPPRQTPYSRGLLPVKFLESDLTPTAWLEQFSTKEEDAFDQCGGFTMLFGLLNPNELYTTTNRGPTSGQATKFESTLVLSNGVDSSWTKLQRAQDLVTPLQSQKDILSECWSVLSTADIGHDAGMGDLRRSIFIPRLGNYGTRTQTVVLVSRDGTLDYYEKQVASEVTHMRTRTTL